MAKDPAFLFYTNDFLSGIQDLTFEERGQFITLLCLQHQKGHLSDKLIKLSVGNAAADVMAKFRQDSAGLWYNVRLDSEIEKRAAHGEKQRQRAVEGWEKRKNNTKQKPKESHGIAAAMPLEDVNVNEDVNEILNEYENWTQQIIDGNDSFFEQMFMNERIPPEANIQHWILDHRDLLNRYPKMRPPNQGAFRKSCIKHIRENYKKQVDGKQFTDRKEERVNGLRAAFAKQVIDRSKGT